MTDYHFVTVWHIDAPIERVWDALLRSDRWPTWWRGVEAVREIEKGDEDGIGNVRRYTWKSKLPYRLVFDVRTTRIDKPHHLEGAASGELEGTGKWLLSEQGDGTDIRYFWDVRTTRWWMNLFAPIARPLFKRNHDLIMGWGGEGLGKLLGAKLTQIRTPPAQEPPPR